jgi:tRNA 2-selenouridine synthase
MQGKETVQRWQAWAEAGELPPLFAELIALHYDPHYGRSQARHFAAWPQRDRVAAPDLTPGGIEAVAEAIRQLPARD